MLCGYCALRAGSFIPDLLYLDIQYSLVPSGQTKRRLSTPVSTRLVPALVEIHRAGSLNAVIVLITADTDGITIFTGGSHGEDTAVSAQGECGAEVAISLRIRGFDVSLLRRCLVKASPKPPKAISSSNVDMLPPPLVVVSASRLRHSPSPYPPPSCLYHP